ncbi:MAG: universal stress protein [Syntrophales bacterium]|jgi:nucleotide-binding universal stress UspA family protein|nr:universal stress protein [Syntrophales bacterium]
MGKDIILYATDSQGDDFSTIVSKKIAPLSQDESLEILCVSASVSKRHLKDEDSGPVTIVHEKHDTVSADLILNRAASANANFIATRFDNDRNGNVSDKILRKSQIPLIVIKGAISPLSLWDHVIVATNWDAVSHHALDFILKYGNRIRELEIIHVINQKLTVKDMRQLKEQLQRTRRMCLEAGIDAEAHIYAGDVGEEILTAAQDYRGSLIVITENRKKPLLKRVLRRRISFEVVQDSEIPVIVLPSNN